MFNKMHKNFYSIFYTVCLSVLLISCGPNDEKLSESVKSGITALDRNIQVSVKDKVVTLSGEVTDEATKNSAETSVKGIKGVKSVINNITVKPMEQAAPPVTINADDQIRQSVSSSFTSKNIQGVNISVANGEVTLTGKVKRADLAKVMQAANESNPKKVINQLTIN